MKAIQEPNVDVHFTAVNEITEDSVIDTEGTEKKVDTVICATGFDVSYRPRFPVIGQNGIDLRSKWKVCPEAYLGITIPDIPNFITFIGPSWPIENGSVSKCPFLWLFSLKALCTGYNGHVPPSSSRNLWRKYADTRS